MDSVFSLTRAILVIFVPGTVVVAPWLLFAINSYPNLAELYGKFQSPFHVAAFTLVVVVGTLIEGWMTYYEKRLDVKESKTPAPEPNTNWLDRDWYDYLSHCFGDKEPVAYRYLSRRVTEMYFYLAMIVATPISILGFGALLVAHGANQCAVVVASLVAAALSVYFFRRFALDSHCLLYNTRSEVMRRLRVSHLAS